MGGIKSAPEAGGPGFLFWASMNDDSKRPRPPLSVVIPARDGVPEARPVLDVLVPLAEASGTEVLVVGGPEPEAPVPSAAVRTIPMDTDDIFVLRHRAIAESRGEIVAIGEDHAVPRPDWCEAVIRAHAEHPDALAVAGCLVNATVSNVAARANFLAFAAEWEPPMPTMPALRPPPSSTVTFKRAAIEGIGSRPPGWFEAELLPALFAEGAMVADERIVVDHYQDHGALWSVVNSFHSSRAAYGYLRADLDRAGRRRVARWTLDGILRRVRHQARAAAGAEGMGKRESALVTAIGVANGLGGTVGTMVGPGLVGRPGGLTRHSAAYDPGHSG